MFIPEEGTLPDFFTNSSVFCLYIWFIFCCLWLLQLYIAVLRFPVVQLVYYIVGFVSGVISPYYKFFFPLDKDIFRKDPYLCDICPPGVLGSPEEQVRLWPVRQSPPDVISLYASGWLPRCTFRLLTSGLLAPGSAENALVLYAVSSSLQVITSSAN